MGGKTDGLFFRLARVCPTGRILLVILIPKKFGVHQSNSPKIPFYQSDLDLVLMAMILKFDLDMVNMSTVPKKKLLCQGI